MRKIRQEINLPILEQRFSRSAENKTWNSKPQNIILVILSMCNIAKNYIKPFMPQAASKNVSMKGCENNSFCSSADNFFLEVAHWTDCYTQPSEICLFRCAVHRPSLENEAQDP